MSEFNTLKDIEDYVNQQLDKTYTVTVNGETKSLSVRDWGYKFEFDKAKRRAGCCKYNSKLITLSKPLCSQNLGKGNDAKIKDTIQHEIAHALSFHGFDSRGHTPEWRTIALQIGSDGKRCYGHKELEDAPSKYTLSCNSCGRKVPRHRYTTRIPSCGKCSPGVYNPKYKMELIKNY